MPGGIPETPMLGAVEVMKIKFNHQGYEDAQAAEIW